MTIPSGGLHTGTDESTSIMIKLLKEKFMMPCEYSHGGLNLIRWASKRCPGEVVVKLRPEE